PSVISVFSRGQPLINAAFFKLGRTVPGEPLRGDGAVSGNDVPCPMTARQGRLAAPPPHLPTGSVTGFGRWESGRNCPRKPWKVERVCSAVRPCWNRAKGGCAEPCSLRL